METLETEEASHITPARRKHTFGLAPLGDFALPSKISSPVFAVLHSRQS